MSTQPKSQNCRAPPDELSHLEVLLSLQTKI